LNPHTVGAAVELIRPYAVDTASGIESAPGHKDLTAMTAFVAAVRSADATAPG
jgi:phosphoribosylanthranilate isomerase